MGPEDTHLLMGQETGVWALACPGGMGSHRVSCREKGLPEEMRFDWCLQDKVARVRWRRERVAPTEGTARAKAEVESVF